VYRLGGTTLDTTIMAVSNGMYRVVVSSQDKTLGGHVIDDLVLDYFAAEFKK
jgi:molecular chaperone DnaK